MFLITSLGTFYSGLNGTLHIKGEREPLTGPHGKLTEGKEKMKEDELRIKEATCKQRFIKGSSGKRSLQLHERETSHDESNGI